MTTTYAIESVYESGEYGPFGCLTLDGVSGRQVEMGEVESDCPRLTVGDFRETGNLDLLDPTYHDAGDGETVVYSWLREDVQDELRAARRRAEAEEREDMITREVEANLSELGGRLVIDVCPRGFCNERESIILDPADREAAERWIAARESVNWSASILTADEYEAALRSRLEGAGDPTTNPPAGVDPLGSWEYPDALRDVVRTFDPAEVEG